MKLKPVTDEIEFNIELDIKIQYTVHPGERATYDCPGYSSEFEFELIDIEKTIHQYLEEHRDELEEYIISTRRELAA